MKKVIGLSGWGGFLASKLRERTEVEWVDRTSDINMFVHLGSPTFTHSQLWTRRNSMKLIWSPEVCR
jgi:hypothetical protein